MRFGFLLALCVGAAPAALAANATHPYSNIDHRNDAGNDTGDARVDALNAAQLDGAGGPRSRFVPGIATIYPGGGYGRGPSGRYAPRPPYPPPPYYPSYPPPYYPAPGYGSPPPSYPY